MSGVEFVHLHVHSEYSLRQGALRLQRLVERTAALGMEAVAVTDSHGLYGAVTFYRLARAAGVRPILGAQLCVGLDAAAGAGRQAQAELDCAVLLAQTLAGYENLVRLVTLAHRRGPVPFVTFAELAEHSEGLAALVGGGESLPLRWWATGQGERAEAWLRQWQEVWPAGHLYVDLQDHGLPEERRGLPALLQWAQRSGLPLVATNDVHYDRPEDADVQRVLAQIEAGPYARVLSGQRYDLAAPEEMARRLAAWPEALRNAVALADTCRVELPLGQLRLPRYPSPGGEPAMAVLRRAAWAGARQRYGSELTETVQARLKYELDVIEQLGFADYFLVVADFIRYAHRQGIATGPGRGSAAGSLVAYALRITDVDPLRHQLLFERFLNPERVSWPDIDTDFEYERRSEVIHYVVQRYGAERVAQIGTFGTLAARAAIRDAGRVLQADAALVDRMAKWIPSQPGVTLAAARAQVPALAELLEQPAAARLWAVAEAIEGFPRHTSVHAAGVVIAPEPLSNLVPVQP
ncbi:MAG: DNA polymerase III subunit alpha, partial [Alicyclobacillus sp.]|nr:DNA polymerase III subunit alpha [Alicyclobacillus sp.]